MNRNKRMIGIMILGMVLISLPIGRAMANEGIDYEEQDNLVTLTVDDLTIMVNAGGLVPKFHYILDNGLSFNIMFKLMAEFFDFNGDDVFQYNESNVWGTEPPVNGEIRYNTILALPSVAWEFSGFVTEESENNIVAIHFNFTSATISAPFYNDLEITIAAHLYIEDQIFDGYQLEGGKELKFDLIVKNWPWQKDDSKLAIRFDISADNEEDQMEQELGNPIDLGSISTGSEQKATHGEGIKESVNIEHGDVEGYFAYSTQSQNRINNEFQTKDVDASYSSTEDNTLQYYLCFEHFDDELVYDPSVGSTVDSTQDFPLYVFPIVSGLIFTTVIILIRRRK
ncbi:MAG: hypothetical protein ACTSPM_02795 [Candidatus Heimdallarchaeota archaeon]